MKYRLSAAIALAPATSFATPLASAETGDDKVLRVCADPNNLPLSNDKGEDYENKIAELLAKDLGSTLEYAFFPHRMGFVRMTPRAKHEKIPGKYKCDLIVGVPVGFDMGATIRPYYRSTYAMVFKKGRGLDDVKVPDDLLKLPPEKLSKRKFGVFSQTPPVDWLLRNKLFDQAISYQRQSGDPGAYPGEIVEKDLVADKLDVAMAWGAIAGYFAKNSGATDLVTTYNLQLGDPTPLVDPVENGQINLSNGSFDFRAAPEPRIRMVTWVGPSGPGHFVILGERKLALSRLAGLGPALTPAGVTLIAEEQTGSLDEYVSDVMVVRSTRFAKSSYSIVMPP